MTVMPTMNISLTDDLRDFVEEQVNQHSYASTSEYVRALLRREREIALLRDTIMIGAAGPRASMEEAYFASLRTLVAGEAVP